MVTFIFTFNLRPVQVQVKRGQILKVKTFFLKHTFFVQLCLRIPKMSFVLPYYNYKFQKSSLKNDVITINWFLGHFTAQNKYIGLIFFTTVGNTELYNMYSVFWVSKILDFLTFIFEKLKFWFLGVKTINFENPK